MSRTRADRALRRAEIESYNALRIPPARLPVAKDGNRWTRTTRVPFTGYTKAANVGGVLALGMALMAKTLNAPRRFRGYLDTGTGLRVQARAAGYTSHQHMLQEQRLAEMKRRAEEQGEVSHAEVQ